MYNYITTCGVNNSIILYHLYRAIPEEVRELVKMIKADQVIMSGRRVLPLQMGGGGGGGGGCHFFSYIIIFTVSV